MNTISRAARKAVPLLVIVLFSLCLSACQGKEPLTAVDFKENAERLAYSVEDISDQFADVPQILTGLSADQNGIHLEFYELDGTDNATAFFNGNKAQVIGFKGNASTESSSNMSSYQKYTLKTSEKYYIVERVQTTVIYANCDKSEAETLNALIKELGY